MQRVRVWTGEDRTLQHTTEPPADEIVRSWEGTTDCGVVAPLHWVPPEVVDTTHACAACIDVTGTTPPLHGQDIPTP